jgi:hypothetical protein
LKTTLGAENLTAPRLRKIGRSEDRKICAT